MARPQRRRRRSSLIGLSIQQSGVREGDEVVVDLDAWFIGHALHEADQAGLLGDAPRSRTKPTTVGCSGRPSRRVHRCDRCRVSRDMFGVGVACRWSRLGS